METVTGSVCGGRGICEGVNAAIVDNELLNIVLPSIDDEPLPALPLLLLLSREFDFTLSLPSVDAAAAAAICFLGLIW